jgi:hypothetical protein
MLGKVRIPITLSALAMVSVAYADALRRSQEEQ